MLNVITTYEEFLTLESDWNRLLSARPEHSVFDTFEWNRLWLKHFQRHYKIHILVLYSKSRNLEISNILPLVKIGHKLYLTGALDRDRSLFLVPPTLEDFKTFISLISSTSFTHLEFRNLPIEEAWNVKWILEDLGVSNKLILKKEYIIHTDSFSLLGRAVGREMDRKIRKLNSQGAVSYEPVPKARFAEYLEFLFSHNESRALDKNYGRRFHDSTYRDWFAEMLENKTLGASPFALTLDDSILAVEVAFKYQRVFSSYSTAFDPRWFRVSPGMLRIPMYAEYGKTHGAITLRLGSGEMGYKQSFTDDYNQLAHVMFFKNRFYQFLYEVKKLLGRIRRIQPIRLIRPILKILFLYPLYLARLHRVFEKRNESKIRILCYHKVNDSDVSSLTVSTSEFSKQLQYLKQKFSIIPLSKMKESLLKGKSLPKNSIAITLDDGYVDNRDIVFPLIKRFNVPVAIFIVRDYIEGRLKFPWDNERQPALTTSNIKEMLSSGFVEFYPHTCTHPLLASLPPGEQRKEIIESKQWIEQLLSKYRNVEISKYLPDIFAYPSGIPGVDFTKETQELVREAGFSIAVSVQGYADRRNLDLFNIERRIASNEPLWMFKLRNSGVIDWIKIISDLPNLSDPSSAGG